MSGDPPHTLADLIHGHAKDIHMHMTGRTTMAALAILGGTAATVTAAAPVRADGSYNIKVDTTNGFVADYCLLATTSGNGRAACSGNKGGASVFRLGAPHNVGDRVWLDVNIRAATDRKGIDLRNMHMIEVKGTVSAVQVCGWKSEAARNSNASPLTLHGTSCDGGDNI